MKKLLIITSISATLLFANSNKTIGVKAPRMKNGCR